MATSLYRSGWLHECIALPTTTIFQMEPCLLGYASSRSPSWVHISPPQCRFEAICNGTMLTLQAGLIGRPRAPLLARSLQFMWPSCRLLQGRLSFACLEDSTHGLLFHTCQLAYCPLAQELAGQGVR